MSGQDSDNDEIGAFIDAQAAGSGSGHDSSAEADAGEKNEYDLHDDFLVTGPVNEDGQDEGQKQKKRKEVDFELDEDDYDLLEENLQRPVVRPEKKKRRLVRAADKDDDLRTKIAKDLFAADEDPLDEDDVGLGRYEDEEIIPMQDEILSEDEDSFDWVVGDDDKPLQRRKKKSQGKTTVNKAKLQELEELFGDLSSDGEDEYREDGEEGQPRRLTQREAAAVKKKKFRTKDQFEPSEIAENFLTQADENIRKKDIPERLQLRAAKMKKVPLDTQAAAEWIFNNAFRDKLVDDDWFIPRIKHVISFIEEQHLEVPFIVHYRKDYYMQSDSFGMKPGDLWEIYEWIEKWNLFQYRKTALLENFVRSGLDEDPYYETARTAEDPASLDLLYQYWFALHSKPGPEAKTKPNLYRICVDAGIRPFAQKFGISAKQLGQNLEGDFVEFIPENPDRSPATLAAEFTCNEFKSTEQVIKAARYILAYEIINDPVISKYLWEVYKTIATVSTTPTQRGKDVIDTYHPYRGIRHTKNKPAHRFVDGEFILMLKAEKEGLIKISVELPEVNRAGLREALQRNYLSTKTDERAEVWNEQRDLIIKDVLNRKLARWEKDLRDSLTTYGNQYVLESVQKSLELMLQQGPFRPPPDTFASDETVANMRVVVVSWNRPEPMVATLLNANGTVVKSLPLPFFPIGREKDIDTKTLSNFLLQHLPHAVIVAITDMGSKRLYEEMGLLIESLCNEHPDLIRPHLAYASTKAARVCANSKSMLSEFGATSSITMRQTVSLGRLLLDPVAELSTLCERDTDLLALKLHRLQDSLPKTELINTLHRVFISMTNGIGVDINDMYNFPHKAKTLQFVAGFGPRKAKATLDVLNRFGELSDRKELKTDLGLGDVIYTNAAGFIRLMGAEAPLDRTRIHPEDYTIATKMAGDCLDLDPQDEDYEMAISDVMRNPEKLQSVSLEAFAQELEDRNHLLKFLTLGDIQKELTHPASEIRVPYRDLGTREDTEIWDEFTDAAGITEQIGMLVTVNIVACHSGGLTCRFDNGLIGKVTLSNLSDEPAPRGDYEDRDIRKSWVESKVGDAKSLQCKIIEFRKGKDQLFAELSCRSTILEEDTETHFISYLKDVYPYMVLPSEEEEEVIAEKRMSREKRRQLRERKITHPAFQNLTVKEAEAFLESQPRGALVIRPSGTQLNRLVLTWKFDNEIIVHINIEEHDKPNPQALGRRLRIGAQDFEDLDEIIATYIDPMKIYADEMFNHRVFVAGSSDDIENMLNNDKRNNPARIPYYFGVSHEYPGRFTLSYLPNQRVKTELVMLTAEGFRFRKQEFRNPDRLIDWFKKHWKDAQPRPRAPNRPPPRAAPYYPHRDERREAPQEQYREPDQYRQPDPYRRPEQQYRPQPDYRQPRRDPPVPARGRDSRRDDRDDRDGGNNDWNNRNAGWSQDQLSAWD